MKRTFIIAFTMLLSCSLMAGEKVLQSSAKHAPKWIGAMEEGYFIASAEAPTLDEAQQKALTRVREQIMYAVATRVQSSTTITLHIVTDNGDVKEHKELTGELSVRAADIPYLANISPSRVEEYYWQKIRRDNKSVYYAYHVKYPLSNSRLRELIADYEKRQRALNDTLQAFASTDFSTFTDLNQMISQHSRLKQFAQSLPEDDPRQEMCKAIRQGYERMVAQNLHAEPVSSDRQATVVALIYGTKRLTFTLRPRTKSNCLTAIQTQTLTDATRISYDYQSGCYDDEENYLDVIYTVFGKKISTRCYIK